MAQEIIQLTLQEQSSAPASPESGNRRLYILNDGRMYRKDSSGNVIQVQDISAGTFANKPTTPSTGHMYFFTDRGNPAGWPAWWNGTYWATATGQDINND